MQVVHGGFRFKNKRRSAERLNDHVLYDPWFHCVLRTLANGNSVPALPSQHTRRNAHALQHAETHAWFHCVLRQCARPPVPTLTSKHTRVATHTRTCSHAICDSYAGARSLQGSPASKERYMRIVRLLRNPAASRYQKKDEQRRAQWTVLR